MTDNRKVKILDTTLRDGTQSEDISYSVEDKIKIAKELDALGINYIEGGNPFSNETDRAFFERMKGERLSARLVAFCSTRRKETAAEDDENLRAALCADTPAVSVFGKCYDMQAEKILGVSLKENLAMIKESVAFLKAAGREVIFDAEHFFDGLKSNRKYALECLKAASDAGADIICLCDTNGGSLPEEIAKGVKAALKAAKKPVGIHCHNDMGLAVAGTMAAVEAGASHVQGTLLGVGERCGNAELSSLIPNLELKLGIGTIGREKLKSLYSVCRRVAQISNMSVWKGKPYVGNSAFAHKGGMHIDAVMKKSESFEHIPPDAVGNERRYLFSNVSGRAAALFAARKVEPSLTKDDPAVSRLIEKIKKLEDSGYRFEAAEASLDLLVRKELGRYKDFFSLESFDIEENYALGVCASTADITISVDGEKKTASATGIGPVHALDKAIREAVAAEFPRLAAVHLVDYKVRVMTPESATAATVAVLIDSTDGSRNWSTVAASVDVIQASANALADAYDYYLQLYGKEL